MESWQLTWVYFVLLEFLCEAQWLTVDPYMRYKQWMPAAWLTNVTSYICTSPIALLTILRLTCNSGSSLIPRSCTSLEMRLYVMERSNYLWTSHYTWSWTIFHYVTFTDFLYLLSLWEAPWLEDRLLGNDYSSSVTSLQYFMFYFSSVQLMLAQFFGESVQVCTGFYACLWIYLIT